VSPVGGKRESAERAGVFRVPPVRLTGTGTVHPDPIGRRQWGGTTQEAEA